MVAATASATVDTKKLEELGLIRKPKVDKKEMGQDDFLKLMTTQLQNQDPFKPMENGDFLAQIAQFSTVDGIGKLQKTFTDLASSLYSNQSLQAANLVGKNVMVPSDKGVYFGEEASLIGALDLESGADKVTVNILDKSGQTVRHLDLGQQKSGRVEFDWDGLNDQGEKMEAGIYKLEAAATVAGKKVGVSTLSLAPVESVSLGKDQLGVSLNLVGLGLRNFSDVRDIR